MEGGVRRSQHTPVGTHNQKVAGSNPAPLRAEEPRHCLGSLRSRNDGPLCDQAARLDAIERF